MSETDYVVREGELEVSQESLFNFNDFYKTMKDWFKENLYTLVEKKYAEVIKGKTKTFKIKWEGGKYLDDFTKMVIVMKIKVANAQQVEYKKEKLTKGTISILFESYLETDYENKIEGKPSQKFWRGIQEKFFAPNKRVQFEKDVKEDTYALYNRIKSFLNIQKYE